MPTEFPSPDMIQTKLECLVLWRPFKNHREDIEGKPYLTEIHRLSHLMEASPEMLVNRG